MLDKEVAPTLGASCYFSKIAFDLARFPSGVIMRTAEAELLSAITMESPILDLACGDGYFASLIKPEGMDAGCDLSKVALERAARRKQYKVLAQCDATRALPFPDGSFATVVSNSSLEHMNGIDTVLREVARVLKPGGKFVFTLGSDYAYKWWPLGEKAKQHYLEFQPVYNYFSLEEWRKRLDKASLALVGYQYYLDKASIQKVIWLDYYFGQVHLTRDWTLARILIRALRFVPRRMLARLWLHMFGKFPICVNDPGGGILIIAQRS